MNYFVIILIAISLSMDAFSLALTIGTLGFNNKINVGLSILVGVFHFFMPFLGMMLGAVFVRSINVDMHILSSIIFFYIAILMFKDFRKENEQFKLSFMGSLIFAFGVSLDSFGVGFTIQNDFISCLLSFLSFTAFSSIFTYLGLKLGRFLNSVIGEYSVLAGAIIMFCLGLINFCQFLL